MKTILTLIIAMIITGAAMGQQKGTGQVKIDTTKVESTTAEGTIAPQPKTYFLLGALQDYQLLYKCLASPGDVTPNELRSVIQWIDKGAKPLPGDTTKKK